MTNSASLEIPDWVPAEVADAARFMTVWALPPVEVLHVAQRLLRDERMKKVWAELNRSWRDDYKPTNRKFHGAKLPQEIGSWRALSQTWKGRAAENAAIGDGLFSEFFSSLARAGEIAERCAPSPPIPSERRHGLAVALYFALAAALYVSGEETVSKKDVDSWETTLRLRGLRERANAVRELVATPQVSSLIVERQRFDPRVRAFVANLAYWCESIFGDSMARTIATTANVAFEKSGRDMLTRDMVKAILKNLH